jgi:hypothetical protein
MAGYKSVLDDISEELEKQGHKTYRASFSDDRASFNLPPEMRLPTKQEQEISSSPVGGKEPFKPHKNDKQFADQNKQLSLPSSSTIQQAAYWPSKQYLVVSFKSGHTYSYDKVPIESVMKWEQASSAGSYFYYNIRMSFRYQKMG